MKLWLRCLLCAIAWFAAVTLISMAQTQPFVTIEWDAIPDPALHHYRVERSLSLTGLSTTTFEIGNVLEFTDTTIDDVTRYYYEVRGIDNLGLAGLISSPKVSQRFQDIQPAMPTVFTCSSIASTQPGKAAIGCSVSPVTKYRSGLLIPTGTIVQYNWYMSTTEAGTSLSATTMVPNFAIQGLKKRTSFYLYATSVVNGIISYGTAPVRKVS